MTHAYPLVMYGFLSYKERRDLDVELVLFYKQTFMSLFFLIFYTTFTTIKVIPHKLITLYYIIVIYFFINILIDFSYFFIIFNFLLISTITFGSISWPPYLISLSRLILFTAFIVSSLALPNPWLSSSFALPDPY